MEAEEIAQTKQINKSGFPFQLRVEYEIENSKRKHDWLVLAREQPFTNPVTNKSEFIDVVLEKHSMLYKIVIECKKLTDNHKPVDCIFLVPDENNSLVRSVRFYQIAGEEYAFATPQTHWQGQREWLDGSAQPYCYESQFCILGSGDKENIIEKAAIGIVHAAEGLGEEYINLSCYSENSVLNNRRFGFYAVKQTIIPVIVTNANLLIAKFESKNVTLNTGSLEPSELKVETVPYIRYRKTFTASGIANLKSLTELNKARERTVFIVNAEHLVDFLECLSVHLY